MFGRKKQPKEESRNDQQSKPRKGGPLMAQLGLGSDLESMEDTIYGDEDDDDLEAELAALQSDSSPEKAKPKPKKKQFDLDSIEKFAKQDVDDVGDDELSDGEASGLMAELDNLSDSSENSEVSNKTAMTDVGDMAMVVEDRLAMYQIAVQGAKTAGDGGKERRLARGVQLLEDMLKNARAGRPINQSDLPPPVALGSTLPRDMAPKGTASQPKGEAMSSTLSRDTAPKSKADSTNNSTPRQQMAPMPATIPSPPTQPAPARPAPARPAPARPAPTMPPAPTKPTAPTKAPAPTKPIPAIPSSKPQISLSKPTSTDPNYVPGCEFVEEADKETHAMLYHRRAAYKQAALTAKREGNIALATSHVRTAKQFDAVILAIEEGKPIDLSKMPPPPSADPPLQSLGAAAAVAVSSEVQTRSEAMQGAGTSQADDHSETKEIFNTPDAPTTILEALTQRLEKYQSAEEDAKKEGNGSKARRMGRIVKQYTDTIKAHKAGKPIDLESLPTPPGFAPIPMEPEKRYATLPNPASVPVARVAPQPTQPAPRPAAPQTSPRPPQTATGQPQSPPRQQPSPQKPVVSPQQPHSTHTLPARLDQQKPGVKKPSMRQEQTLSFLKGRMAEFKEAAIKAKKNDDIELAKKYYRFAKGCEPMIQATEAGLPVDLSQVPEAPSPEDDKFMIVADQSEVSGDRDEMYKKLQESLVQQIQTSVTNAQHYTKLGDIPMASKFKKFEQNSRKDLDSLKSGHKHGDPVPRFHYETRTFSMIKCNTDLGENDLELTVIRGLQYKLPSGYTADDLSTMVKYEFPFPCDELQVGYTDTSKKSCDPEYNESFAIQINRKARAFSRVVERKTVKLEVFYKRGFLKSDKTLGTVNVPLLPLDSVCTQHETYDPAATSQPKKSKGDHGTTSIEVMKYEKGQLDRQISFLKESLTPSQMQTLNDKSHQIQDKIDSQQASLKAGGVAALKAYAAQLEAELQPYEDEARAVAKQGDMQKAQTLLTKKKEGLKELNAIRARLKVMT